MQRPEGATLLLDYTQDKIAVVDEEGTFTYANDAAESILGYEPDELIGEDAFEYIHPDDVGEAREAFERVIGTEDRFAQDTVEYRFRARDGSWVWLQSRMSNLTDSALSGYVVSSRDVTDRVEAERKRRETETRLAELAGRTEDVLWMFDGDWEELLFCNPAVEDVYGMPVEEIEADPTTFLDAIHPEDVPAVEEAMNRLSEGEALDIEYRVGPEGDYDRYVWVQGEPITRDGEVVRIVGVTRDVTDRRRRERQLAVMDNLLRHNLRNDMNVILGNAELIGDEAESEATADRVAVIRRVGESLLETADKQRRVIDLLTGPVSRESIDLGGIVTDAVERTADRYPSATVTTDIPEGARVRAIEEVGAAVVELVENAVVHGNGEDSAPRVEVTGRTGPDTVSLTVRDDCQPLPRADAQVLTGDHEMDSVYHSTGLGLWLVYWVVNFSDGDIDYRVADGGNEITLTLPRATG